RRRPVCRALSRMILPSARRALFTDLGSGNSSATSGSRTTIIVPFANLLAYLPRTPPEKSYSGSMSSGSRLERAFFVLSPLLAGRESRADDSNRLLKIRMYHDQSSISFRPPDRYQSALIRRMERVADGDRESISKDRRGLLEGDPVLSQVRASLLR